MNEDVAIFSAEFGELIKLEDWGRNDSNYFQIEIGNNRYGRVIVTILVREKSSFHLRFFNKKIEEIRRQYWGVAPIDFPSEPFWYSAAYKKIFEGIDKDTLKEAVDVLKENEGEPMSDEVKYYFNRTLKIFTFLLSDEGQKFINENNVQRNYRLGNSEGRKKVEKVIEEVYAQLNAI